MDFGPLTIAHDARVLEPRPWTVLQSRWAADLSPELPGGPLLELCTGAGHIGLLAVHLSGRPGVLVDVDPAATWFAHANAERAGLADRVEVRLGRAEEAVRPDESFGLVIADPPWVPSASVGRFPDDPLLAIDGGHDGLAIAWTCLTVMGDCLAPGGAGLLQLGDHAQVDAVREWLARDDTPALRVTDVRAHEDRGVVALLRWAG
ncbi:class I SAM-dependent methyltransferase [Nocardioides sp. Y6]|uniref:Class I SAM-dependent methyltransferase n=2 Tax=Nocardioides malaquae TaxID=2773426 RepID=A0ABR9RX69_9ACTN|nr:class I SAM-dependent methyltransferase [Nocardioides malaquae]